MMEDRGIIYVASQHARFLCEAIRSAMTATVKVPGVPISLFTDIPALFGRDIEPFDRVIPLPIATSEPDLPDGRAKLAKVRSIARSPYKRTIFLDSDTRVRSGEVASLFELLSDCEFAAVPCTPKNSRSCALYGPMFNTGVIAYRLDDKTRALFRGWEAALLFHLGLVHSKATKGIPYLARLNAASKAFLLTTDQLSLAQTLSPARNDLGIEVRILDDSWNARNYPRNRLRGVRVDHANCHKVPAEDVDDVLGSLGLKWLRAVRRAGASPERTL